MGGMEPVGATGVPSPFCPLSLRVCWLRIPSLSGNSDAHQYPSILLYVCQAACSFTLIHPLISCHIHYDFQKSTRTLCPPLNSLSSFLFSLVYFFFPFLYSHQNRIFRGKAGNTCSMFTVCQKIAICGQSSCAITPCGVKLIKVSQKDAKQYNDERS